MEYSTPESSVASLPHAPITVKQVLHLSVIIASLGYFVDIYDLLLFGIVRVPSLRAIGIAPQDLMKDGVFLLNMQMGGMLIGGILWGILGDKRGRLTVLFGSILLYSIANIANGAVTSIGMYGILRFLAGIGLAGELGAAVTLVTETLHTSKRGYGTALVATIGILGAVFAGFVAELTNWRTAYVVGGVLGFALLILRIRVTESGMFKSLQNKQSDVPRGDIRLLFATRERTLRYLACIAVGIPTWYVMGILVTFSPEFARELGVIGEISAAKSIGTCYAVTAIGGLVSGFLSQYWYSRKRVLFAFLALTAGCVPLFLMATGVRATVLYAICGLIGFGAGYWAVFMTVAAEQFGTNLRATVATTVPNFVRGSVVPVTLAFQLLRSYYSLRVSAAIIGVPVFAAAFWAAAWLKECSTNDLNFLET